VGITAHTFWNGANGSTPVLVSHFEVIETGPRIAETWNCVRSTVTVPDVIFQHGFDD
jgi:hypothetical protein